MDSNVVQFPTDAVREWIGFEKIYTKWTGTKGGFA